MRDIFVDKQVDSGSIFNLVRVQLMELHTLKLSLKHNS